MLRRTHRSSVVGINGDPNARNDTIRVVVAIACLIGLNGVWSYIAQQAR